MTNEAAARTRFLAFRYRLYIEHDLSAVDEYLHPEFTSHSAMIPGTGRDAYKSFIRQFHEGLPDLQPVDQQVLVEDGQLMAMTTWKGTHSGTFLGVPATNKAVSIDTADRYALRDDLLFQHWDVVDRLSASLAIGLLKPA